MKKLYTEEKYYVITYTLKYRSDCGFWENDDSIENDTFYDKKLDKTALDYICDEHFTDLLVTELEPVKAKFTKEDFREWLDDYLDCHEWVCRIYEYDDEDDYKNNPTWDCKPVVSYSSWYEECADDVMQWLGDDGYGTDIDPV